MQSDFLEPDFLSNKRILVFGINRIQSGPTFRQISEINQAYNQFLSLGIDEVYCISFCDFLLFDQLVPRLSKKIKFFQDQDNLNLFKFQTLLNKRGHRDFLKQFWQFVCILNNGQVEFYREQPFDKLDKDPDTVRYIYNRVSPEVVLKELMRE